MKTLALTLFTIVLCSPAALAQISFEHLAPENSVIVVGVHNVTTTTARFRRTALDELWRSDEIQKIRSEAWEDMEDGFDEALREAGVSREDLVMPSGAVGMALFPVMDPETGSTAPAYVLFADFGERADRIQRVISAVMEHGEREGQLTSEVREIIGRTVHSITFGPEEDDWGDEADDDWQFDDPMMMGPGFDTDGMFDGFKTMHIARDGGAFIVCNDIGAMTDMLDRIDREVNSGLAERTEFRTALDQVGSNDMYAVVLTRDLMQVLSGLDPTGGMVAGMLPPMMKSLLGDIRALSSGMLLDAPEAMLRLNMGVYMPHGKQGITKLMDISKPRADLPSFVGADAYSYSALSFAFRDLADAAQQFVQANPMLQMMGAAEAMIQIDPMIRQMTASLGSSVHIVNTVTRPIELDSMQMTMAIESTDTQQFETMFSGMAAEWGMEGRDFLGHRIYTAGGMGGMMGPGMGVPEMAIGIGAGHVFMGNSAGVEQALRASAEPDRAAGLAEDAAYRRAVSRIPDVALVGWGYTDWLTMMEGTVATMKEAQREWERQMREMFPEMADDMDFEDDANPLDKIDIELLKRYLGPSVAWFRSTDNGFVGTTLYFSADEVKVTSE